MADFVRALASHYDYLMGQKLVPLEPTFAKGYLSGVINLDGDGNPLGYDSFLQQDGKFWRGRELDLPQTGRSSDIKSRILYDDTRYVLGVGENNKSFSTSFGPQRSAFYKKVRAIAALLAKDGKTSAIIDAIIAFENNIGSFLASIDANDLLDDLIKFSKQKSKFMISFMVDGESPFDDASLAPYLSEVRLDPDFTFKATCAITGVVTDCLRIHPPHSQIPSSAISPRLISCNENFSESWGRGGHENNPVAIDVALKHVRALSFVLSEKQVFKTDRRALVIFGEGGVVDVDCILGPYPVKSEVVSHENVASSIREAVTSVDGTRAKRPRDTGRPLHILELFGNAGRTAVSGYRETTAEHVYQNLNAWFDDMCLDVDDKPIPIWQFIAAMRGQYSVGAKFEHSTYWSKEYEQVVRHKLLTLALDNDPVPRETMLLALNALERTAKSLLTKAGKDNVAISRVRFANHRLTSFLKIFVNRSRKGGTLSALKPGLDTTNTETAYVLGRIAAIMVYAQDKAAEATDGAAANSRLEFKLDGFATAPLAFQRDFEMKFKWYKHLLQREGRAGTAFYVSRLMNEVHDLLGTEPFPKSMSPEQRSVFHIAYRQQSSALYRKASPTAVEATIEAATA